MGKKTKIHHFYLSKIFFVVEQPYTCFLRFKLPFVCTMFRILTVISVAYGTVNTEVSFFFWYTDDGGHV